jgi:hypothetical protein
MASTVSRIYSNFRGADFRGEEINLARSPDCLNVWKDYREIDSIRTRPGMQKFNEIDFGNHDTGNIYGIYFFNDEIIVHRGKGLYFTRNGDTHKFIWGTINEAQSSGFVYDNKFYFIDGNEYRVYDGESIISAALDTLPRAYENRKSFADPYIPTTTIARKPSGGGTKHEDVNLLTGFRKNSFLADGESKEYYLDTMSIDDQDHTISVIVNGEELERSGRYEVDHTQGKITFKTAPEAPSTDGQDNVFITFRKNVPGYRERILKCTLWQVFDNRVFASGNPDYPNTVWHCSLDDPTYWSDTDYYYEGLDQAKVTGLVAGNNALWVFREPSSSNTTVFYHTPVIDEDYGKIYPSVHSSITTGCIGKAINFNDDIVFFSERGMEGISGDVTTEQAISHRSTVVDRKLIAEQDYKNMILEEWEGYLLVIIGSKVYLADSRTAFTNEDHIEYDWFYWELERPVCCTCVHEGVLYLGCDDGIYTLTDMTANVKSYWTTPKDKFMQPHKLKTTNKRGCVAEATGDITVYAKLEDTDFELIGEYKDVTDYFVSRIKRKKFKDIQLKFESNTRFSLETVTLEAFIGGYIKR